MSAPRVAFQGELGAFSEEAIGRFFDGGETSPIPCRDFDAVGRAVVAGEVEYGVLPVENSIAGGVTGAYDVLASGQLRILAELVRPIRHCVIGLPGTSVADLRRIVSHPVALAQCGRFLQSLGHAEAVAVYDTAGAAMQVAAAGESTLAAIAPAGAAERYGLEILRPDVQDSDDNRTRFLLVTARDHQREWHGAGAAGTKAMLCFETEHRPGALLEVLSPFAARGISLTRIESRPTAVPWQYRFFIEIVTDSEAAAAAAIADARHATRVLFDLGRFNVVEEVSPGP